MSAAREDLAAASWRLRPMTQADLSRVAQLERESYVFPWNDQIFADCLRVGYHCVVVETAAGVSGYGVLSMGAGEAHVLNLCIAEGWRRRGIGRRLLVALLALIACARIGRGGGLGGGDGRCQRDQEQPGCERLRPRPFLHRHRRRFVPYWRVDCNSPLHRRRPFW